MVFCSACGVRVTSPTAFCGNCGTNLRLQGASTTPINTPVVMVTPARSAKERANDTTEVIGRVGCNLLVGFIIFKVVVVIALLVVVVVVWTLISHL
jgi:hypothetical protein